ncbi:MAG TPA: hypothetical protein VJW76_09880, partial [Verrucomicrobiae bacterium]|nr:hypothetical protein [Verrucomicrobiae bacterium]
PFGTMVVSASSKPFSVVLRDTPTPLVGLESLRLGSQDFRVERHGDNLIIRWNAYGNTSYSLQATTNLAAAGSWSELWRGSNAAYPNATGISVTNAIAGEQRFFRLMSWRSLSAGREAPGSRTVTSIRTER